ncbi:hypothetical protein EG347_10620 [Chryseobacterium sp. G0186]|uniref:hypothetical protein n=1 Tax=Chryseobacterium sp. G0186 TaxID=2487064 RepID=UPI000F4F6B89|nr:hypothetical protein [Chryseobacterium sp. G0186]AZA77941.1 hypothetical protein EG347_10620 [Chryseobacterium sp. G0186]
MKTKILLLFLPFPFSIFYSQTVVYDFFSGEFDKKNINPRRGVPVSLKINRINPFFYEIVIKSEDKEISYQNTDVEAAKKSLDELQQNNYYKMQESFVFEESYVTLLSSGKSSNTNPEISNLQKKYFKLDSLALKINQFKSEKDDLAERIKMNESARDINYEKNKNSLQNEIVNKNNDIYLVDQKILKIQYEIKQLESKSTDTNVLMESINKKIVKLNTAYNKFIDISREFIKLNQNYNNYIDKVISPELTYEMYESIIENQKNNTLYKKCKENKDDKECNDLVNKNLPVETTFFLSKDKLNYAYGVFNAYPELYQEVIMNVNDFISFLNYGNLNFSSENDLLKSSLIKDVERIQKSIKVADDVVQKINLSKKLNEVEILDRLLRKSETYEYVSAPIQGEEDYLEFDVVIKSKRNLSNTYHINNDKNFRYFEYITGGIRFDFSVGTVFDFGTIDRKYTLDSNSAIQRLDNNKYNPTIAGIFHASFRNSSDFAWGLSLGASFTTGLSFNSIFPGVSLLMGKRNKIILTAGPSFRLVDELKANYKEGMQLNNSLADEDLLTKNFRIGGFVGISYNLTPKQKDTLKLK